MTPAATAYASLGRARKVLAMLRLIPTATTPAGNAAVAAELASWTQADRDRFAAGHRVTPPSETTWAQLCAAVRARGAL